METPKKKGGKPASLAYWFWGAIIVMAVLTLGLSIAAMLRQPDDQANQDSQPPQRAPGLPSELAGTELSTVLTASQQKALEPVLLQLDQKLDKVYAPVYAAIPVYVDFHYSVPGQYLELFAAANGALEQDLADRLFSDFDARMSTASTDLTNAFSHAFRVEIDNATQGAGGTSAYGELTRRSLADAKMRFAVSAPLNATAAAGTGLAVKTAVKAVAKKMAGKMAVKTAGKAGGKWVAAGTGAGAGALACSWAGPGAGLCAAAAGVGAWFATDFAMVKLDELWSRKEFEADLRKMVYDQKVAHRAVLKGALRGLAADTKLRDEIVQRQDFTLRQMADGTNTGICAIVAKLKESYEPMRGSLAARSPEALQALREMMQAQAGDLTIGPMVKAMAANLDKADRVWLTSVQIKGNLPADYRANRDVSGQMTLNGRELDFDRTAATEAEGFAIHLPLDLSVALDKPVIYGLAIEQHLRLLNRHFDSSGVLPLRAQLAPSGLTDIVTQPITLARTTEEPDGEPVSDRTKIDISISIYGNPLPELTSVPDCP